MRLMSVRKSSIVILIVLFGWFFIGNAATEARGQINAEKCRATTDRKEYRYPRDETVDDDDLKLTIFGPPQCMPSGGGDGSELMIQKSDRTSMGKALWPSWLAISS